MSPTASEVRESGRSARDHLLLGIVQELAEELHPGAQRPELTLDSSLERDGGIDSLARIELLARLERRLGISVPESLALAAESPRDLMRALPAERGDRTVAPVQPLRVARGTAGAPADSATLTEVLRWHAERHPEQTHVLLYGENDALDTLSYGALLAQAEAVAAGLRELDIEPGQAVALMLPTGSAFFFCLYGILLAGGVPVPLYPPQRMSQIEEHLRRQIGILANARARVLVATEQALALSALLKTHLPELRGVTLPARLAQSGAPRAHLPLAADALALLQYTSGSTGSPKGVALSHANLLANVRAMGAASRVSGEDVFVSWLPLYHDMGLIGACFGTLYHGFPLVLMSPLSFIARPRRWLHAIHRHRATLSAAPNFAYDLCATRLAEQDLEGLDLATWRLAFNGAEPVNADTLDLFCRRFAPYGFRRESMTPVYGLAECSVGLAFPPPGREPHIDAVRRHVLARAGRAEPAEHNDDVVRVVGCGSALPGHEIRIVDTAGRELPDREVGRLEFRGPSATRGYFHNEEATRALFRDGWLDSGDYAYTVAGEVFPTGRAKEIIIRAGRNLYPYELEEAVGALTGIRKHAVAVFAARGGASERLVVVAETRERRPERHATLREQIALQAQELLQSAPDDIVLAAPGTVPKTSSGKIRRAECRALYERGALGRRRAVWAQLTRLALAGAAPLWQRTRRGMLSRLFNAHVWTFAAVLALPVVPALLLVPSRRARRALARGYVRLLLVLSATPLRVEGLEHLPREGTALLCANHASYIDGFVLLAALPADFDFVAKRELASSAPLRMLLERVGTTFVERFDARQGVEDVGALAQSLGRGRSLLFFPEGTFTRAAGLRPFRLGAFVLAAQTATAVVPVTLRGTRSILRSDQWLLRRGTIRVIVEPPIAPEGADWSAALQLRERTRAVLLRRCGEPDLAPAATSAEPSAAQA